MHLCLLIYKVNQNAWNKTKIKTQTRHVYICHLKCSVSNELLQTFGIFHTALKSSANKRYQTCTFIALDQWWSDEMHIGYIRYMCVCVCVLVFFFFFHVLCYVRALASLYRLCFYFVVRWVKISRINWSAFIIFFRLLSFIDRFFFVPSKRWATQMLTSTQFALGTHNARARARAHTHKNKNWFQQI